MLLNWWKLWFLTDLCTQESDSKKLPCLDTAGSCPKSKRRDSVFRWMARHGRAANNMITIAEIKTTIILQMKVKFWQEKLLFCWCACVFENYMCRFENWSHIQMLLKSIRGVRGQEGFVCEWCMDQLIVRPFGQESRTRFGSVASRVDHTSTGSHASRGKNGVSIGQWINWSFLTSLQNDSQLVAILASVSLKTKAQVIWHFMDQQKHKKDLLSAVAAWRWPGKAECHTLYRLHWRLKRQSR